MHDLAGIPQGLLLTGASAESRDEALAQRLADGSRLAFRVAYSVLRQREDAEDVAQEALARACRRFASLREPARFRGWLVRICWRLALNHRRASQRRERRERVAADPVEAPSVEQQAAALEFRLRLWDAIDALPQKLRLVIVLAGIEGHDLRAVAALAGIPEGTVKSRLYLARKRLAEVLK